MKSIRTAFTCAAKGATGQTGSSTLWLMVVLAITIDGGGR